MRPVFAVQLFRDGKWKSIYIASFLPDAVESYRQLDEITDDEPIRLARFMVTDFDFVAIHCRDFAVIRRTRH